MNDKERAVMQQALEALESSVATCFDRYAYDQFMSRPEHFVNQAITAIREALAEQPAQQEQDRQIDQLIQERDHRDEIIDKLCDAVLGPDRYEWSSQYFFEDAVREVEERMAALRERRAKERERCAQIEIPEVKG
jgi:hypothetical protein|nr:MAG TPA: hypothetical protein [Caudoviricetes sp.]